MSTSIGISFEDEIREFLHRIGFSDVPRWGDDRTRLFLGEQEIDAFGRLGDLYIVVDAKASTSPSTSAAGTQRQLTYISGYKPRVEIVIQNEYRQHGYRYCVFIYWTKNKKLSQRHIDFARENNIAIRDETDLKYYRDALDLLENPEIVRNSFIKDVSLQIEEELFQIGPNIEVPAIQTRIGDKTFYTFQLQAETLLKLSYVFRLETNNLNILFSYQRLLKKEKIRSIREYLRNGGFFANNILVVSDEELEFRPIGSRSSNRYQSIGNIMLIDKPCYLEIIDGQHRLLAYSNLNELLDNCLCVTIISNLDRRDRARTFVTVNKEQTRVKSSLLWLLYQRTDPDSLEAQISIFVQNLNERGILKNFIIIPGVRSPLAYLSFTQICNALYNRTNLMQNYGSISSFYQVVNAFFTTIRNGNDTLIPSRIVDKYKNGRII